MANELPGGRGERFGQDSLVERDEAYELRRLLQRRGTGWFITTMGENVFPHFDVTGVNFTASQLQFFYIPDRFANTKVSEARLTVATLDAGSTLRSALYIMDKTPTHRFVKIAGTEVVFDSSSTGLKKVTLGRQVDIPGNAKLFLGFWSSSAVTVVEGFQSGTAGDSRVVRQRAVAAVTAPLGYEYFMNTTSLTTDNDAPWVVYLSPEAASIF